MTYTEQIRKSVKILETLLLEEGLRGQIIEQRKTWITFYKREILRLTNGGKQLHRSYRRKDSRSETKQRTAGRPRGGLEEKYNDNKVFAG